MLRPSRPLLVIFMISFVCSFIVGFCVGSLCTPTSIIQAPAPAPASSFNINGKSFSIPDGNTVEIALKNQMDPLPSRHVTNTSIGVATGVETHSGAVAEKYQSDLPNTKAGLRGTSSDAGDIDFSLKGLTSSAISALYWIGGIAILIGVVLALGFKQMMGLSLVIGGIILIACAFLFETYPWVLLVAALVVVGVIGYLLYRHYKGTSTATSNADALTGIVMAIEAAPQAVQDQVKSLIAQQNAAQDGNIKAVVNGIKSNL